MINKSADRDIGVSTGSNSLQGTISNDIYRQQIYPLVL